MRRPPPDAGGPEEKTARVVRRRFTRRQWARRWLAWRALLVIALTTSAVAGTVWLIFFSPVLAVAEVQVEGTELLSPAEVRSVAAVPRGEPLATADLDAAAARVEGLVEVKTVAVSRAWPDKVSVVVDEREAVALVERDGVTRGLDDEGVVFRRFRSAPPDLPLVLTATDARTEALTEALAEAAEIVGSLPGGLARRVDLVEVETIDAISLQMRSGNTIVWGSAEQSDNKAAVVVALLDAAPRAATYDVRVPGQPTTSQ